jgi:hypothetical protein
MRRRELNPNARGEPDAPHQVLPFAPVRPMAAPVPLEDHQVCGFVTYDLIAQLHRQIQREARDPHQTALGVTAAERALQALPNDDREPRGQARFVPHLGAALNDAGGRVQTSGRYFTSPGA